MKSNKTQIKALIIAMAERHHGEIFMEFFKSEGKNYSIADFKKELDEMDVKEYFKENNGHGEYAGLAMRACLNDSNLELALFIHNNTEDWDS